MSEIEAMFSMLEQRVTLLERRLAQLIPGQNSEDLDQKPAPSSVTFLADDPGLVFSGGYHLEKDAEGDLFVWLGGPGDLQVVLPVAPTENASCKLLLFPHSAVAIDRLTLRVNDIVSPYFLEATDYGRVQLSFTVEKSSSRVLNILFSNIMSIRPVDLGEGADFRLLALKFIRADVKFGTTLQASGFLAL